MQWKLAAALAVTLASATAAAQSQAFLRHRQYPLGTVVDAGVLTSPQSFSVDMTERGKEGYAYLTVYVKHTQSAATALTMACTNTPDADVGAATPQECTIATGTCTSDDATWTKTTGSSQTWPWRVNIRGFVGAVACTVTGTSAGAGDILTAKAWLVTGG